MFDWCAELYFRALWEGHLKEKEHLEELQEYYKGEGPEVIVKYAKQMMHTSVIETVNQGVVPIGINRDGPNWEPA